MKEMFLFLICTTLFCGCYRMPTDDDYCVIPTTNNPDVTREAPSQMMPGMKM